jgi:hypothetical protein
MAGTTRHLATLFFLSALLFCFFAPAQAATNEPRLNYPSATLQMISW